MILKLDLDLKEDPEMTVPRMKAIFWEIGRRIALIDYFLGISPVELRVRETNKGFHVYITTEEAFELEPELIVAIQLILMSDWKRELFNLRRIINDRINKGEVSQGWNVLFLRKKDHEKELSNEQKTELSMELADRLIEGYETQISYLSGEKN